MDKINIAYCTDLKGSKLLCKNIDFLKKHLINNEKLDIYIYNDLDQITFNSIFSKYNDSRINIKYRYVNPKIYEKCYIRNQDKDYYSIATYYRFEILKENECDKILYLDTDVFVRSDLRNLYNLDMYDSCKICGVKGYPLEKNDKQLLPLDYINAGVILMDIRKICNDYNNILNICHESQFYNHDQDIINFYYKNEIQFIDTKYNFFWNTFVFETRIIDNILNNVKNDYIHTFKQPLDLLYEYKNRISFLHITGNIKYNDDYLNIILSTFD